MKNACASESCPVMPTSSVRPIAPIAALIANRPVCSQNASTYCGSHSSTATSPTKPSVRLDTGQLPRPEEAGRAPQQDREQHDVWHDVRQSAAEKVDLVLVAGRQLLRNADHQTGNDRAG